jgi:hypothetical protein
MFIFKQMRRVGLAVVAVGSIGVSGQAFADGTNSGDTISNTATVNYTVATVAQTPVSATNSFTVDTIIRFNLTGGATVNVAPGQTNQYQTYTLTNTSNTTSQFTLAPSNDSGDDFDMNLPSTTNPGVNVYADTNTNGVYDPGTDVQVVANVSLGPTGPAQTGVYFLVGDTPIGATNNQDANVTLLATAINPADSLAWVNDNNPDIQGGVGGTAQIVVGNGTASRPGTFHVQTATLAVSKTSSVISDPINLTGAGRKAIPGAVMQYEILVVNSGSSAATLQNITDPVPASTTFRQGDFTGATDVEIQVGAAPATYCIAEAGADGNADGCFRTGATLTISAPAITTVAASSQVAVRFRVTIQ